MAKYKFKGGYSHVKRGRAPDLGNRFFRSRVEKNYARYLNFLVHYKKISKWEYEPDEFEFPVKRGTRFYLPDFKIWNNDGTIEYHETKGYFDQKSRTKLARMKLYYPQIKVVLINSQTYNNIAKAVSKLIPTWE